MPVREMIDFTNCKTDIFENYGGSDKKLGILYNGYKYMLKMSDAVPDEKGAGVNSSYTNSAFSEDIGCRIFRSIGFDVQETVLGTIMMPRKRPMYEGEFERVYPAVACKNFVPEGSALIEFKSIENAVLGTKPPKIPRIKDIYLIFTGGNEYFSKEFARQALERYWDTFIVDALIGDFDRHANNWGYLVNRSTGKISLAPVYDCGSCLYPQVSDNALRSILSSEEEIQMRIDKFPTAALELEDGKKASYKGYISSFSNPDCTQALLRVVPKINMDKINKIIDDTPGISDIRKEFYSTMLCERYKQIILEPYLQCYHEQ